MTEKKRLESERTFFHARLHKIQREMKRQNQTALLLTDSIHLRYATGISMMPLWAAFNYCRYALVPADGEPILFEYPEGMKLAQNYWSHVRPTTYWQYRFDNSPKKDRASAWAQEISGLLKELGLPPKVAIDSLDARGFLSLTAEGIEIADSDPVLQAARLIKLPSEIAHLNEAMRVTETALQAFKEKIQPGVTENQLLATFWESLLAQGGEWCYTRLISSGERTNPWFQEAGDHVVKEGDLVGIDTDVIGPLGYACDISRTFLCGDKPTEDQRHAYRAAYDFIQSTIPLCQPGRTFVELCELLPEFPKIYETQGYPVFLHGLGVDDEMPFVPFPRQDGTKVDIPNGEIQVGMVLCVEFYAGKVGGRDGVKLEEQILITEEGPQIMSSFPYEKILL